MVLSLRKNFAADNFNCAQQVSDKRFVIKLLERTKLQEFNRAWNLVRDEGRSFTSFARPDVLSIRIPLSLAPHFIREPSLSRNFRGQYGGT